MTTRENRYPVPDYRGPDEMDQTMDGSPHPPPTEGGVCDHARANRRKAIAALKGALIDLGYEIEEYEA